LLTEMREALEQQTATAEVLGVINSSPGDLAPVFEAMLEKALRLCEATQGVLRTFDGELFHPVAVRGELGAAERLWQRAPIRAGRGLEPLLHGEQVIHIADVWETDIYRGNPVAQEALENVRTLLAVALRRDDALLGVIITTRSEVHPFTDKQIALL